MVYITRHAEERMFERLNLDSNEMKKLAKRAIKHGFKHSEFKGPFLKFLNRLYLNQKKANNIRVYSNYIFMFHKDILLTVISIPIQYRNYNEKKEIDK